MIPVGMAIMAMPIRLMMLLSNLPRGVWDKCHRILQL